MHSDIYIYIYMTVTGTIDECTVGRTDDHTMSAADHVAIANISGSSIETVLR